MTGIEALQKALETAQMIEVHGKQNLINLFYVMQLLEEVLELQKEVKADEQHHASQAAVVHGSDAEG